jgi:hypothetical protein
MSCMYTRFHLPPQKTHILFMYVCMYVCTKLLDQNHKPRQINNESNESPCLEKNSLHPAVQRQTTKSMFPALPPKSEELRGVQRHTHRLLDKKRRLSSPRLLQAHARLSPLSHAKLDLFTFSLLPTLQYLFVPRDAYCRAAQRRTSQ